MNDLLPCIHRADPNQGIFFNTEPHGLVGDSETLLATLLDDKQVQKQMPCHADAVSCATLAALPLHIALTNSIGKDILFSILFKT